MGQITLNDVDIDDNDQQVYVAVVVKNCHSYHFSMFVAVNLLMILLLL